LNLKPQQVIQSIKTLFSPVSNKNFSEYYLTVWPRWPKNPPLMTSLTKNPPPPTKNFFHCKLQDLPSLLRVWTAL